MITNAMVRRVPGMVLLLVLLLSAVTLHAADDLPGLSGTYVSDRDATLAYLQSTGAYTQEQLDKIGEVLGRMTVTFIGDMLVTELDGKRTEEKFRIEEQTADHALILTHLADEEPVRARLEFAPDGYWLAETVEGTPYREKFRRMP